MPKDGNSIPAMIEKLKQEGLVTLGEQQDVTLDIRKRIDTASI
ncbi:aldehyde reductase [Xenorhabdus beddingii]|uniref:Aldehyde reductase n=1 Tax=Xenorhabdus beddingii TaxID=40578 RepID=A0A1Y2SQY6_9GAMM|nr:hypothetical protein [Xenorhabdus beddingii]OTA21413.1 aldehyde reductase [Xenorhabdus beddingii]